MYCVGLLSQTGSINGHLWRSPLSNSGGTVTPPLRPGGVRREEEEEEEETQRKREGRGRGVNRGRERRVQGVRGKGEAG